MANSFGALGGKNFSSGYKPGEDFLNGDENSLVRMDNAWLDESGALTITRAPVKINTLSLGSPINALFSAILNNKKTRFAQLATGQVLMDTGSGTWTTQLSPGFTSQITRPVGFGQGFGKVFMGPIDSVRPGQETDGLTIQQWGLPAFIIPPTVSLWTPASAATWYLNNSKKFNDFTVIAGTLSAKGDGFINVTSVAGVAGVRYTINQDLNTFNTSEGGAPTDVFYLAIYTGVDSTVTTLKVSAFSGADHYDKSFDSSYFQRNYPQAPGWSLISCLRSDFVATGAPNWAAITKVEINLSDVTPFTYAITQPFEFYNNNDSNATLIAGVGDLVGGDPYVYTTQQVWVNTNYVGRGPTSPFSRPVWGKIVKLFVGQPNIAGLDARTNRVDYFKSGGTIGGDFYLVNSSVVPNFLVVDKQTDQFYLSQVGDGIVANTFLATIGADAGNTIIGVAGPINGRMVFISSQHVFFSDYLNPESYDTRLVLTLSGQTTEIILWCEKVSRDSVYVGTTMDIYPITGTIQPLADGTFDINIGTLGVGQPPICPAFAAVDNSVMWVAKDGLRQSYVSLMSQQSKDLNLFFRGQACFGVPGFLIQPFNTLLSASQVFDLEISKQKIYLRTIHTDQSQSMYAYDIQHGTWYRRVDPSSPICIFAEIDDTLLAGYSDGFIRIYEEGPQFDSITNQNVTIQTTCRDGGEPNTRKDLFTLKLNVATGSGNITPSLVSPAGQIVALGTYAAAGRNPQVIPVACNEIAIDKSHAYSLLIQGSTDYFKLTSWTLDYYAHPEPQVFYREPPNSFGHPGKKRIRTLPIVLDCLNNSVQMQGIVDGQNVGVPQIFTGSGKQTYYYMYSTDVNGIDYSYTLYAGGQFFEPYGLGGPVSVEEMPPPTLEDQLGPVILDKRGKLYGFRVRLISSTTFISYTIFMDDVAVYSSTFLTSPNIDTTYEVNRLPASIIGNQCRVVLTATLPFYRYNGKLRVTASGMMSSQKWINLNKDMGQRS